MDVSDIFSFFSPFLGAGEGGGVRGGGRGGGGRSFLENRVRGGGRSEEEAREGEGRRGNVCGDAGGGAKCFFVGAEMPTKLFSELKIVKHAPLEGPKIKNNESDEKVTQK